MGNTKKAITHSMLATFLDCRKKFEYRYLKGITPTGAAPALDFGAAYHRGLEFWVRFGSAPAALDAAQGEAEARGMGAAEIAKLLAMLEGYFRHHPAAELEKYEAVEAEVEFKAPIRNPKTGRKSQRFFLRGKADALLTEEGRVWIVEYKTAADISPAYLKKLSFDTQIAIYMIAISATRPVAGVIYDISRKPALRLKKDETPEAFRARVLASLTAEDYVRVVIPFDEAALTPTRSLLWAAAQELKAPPIFHTAGACLRAGLVCPFLDLCAAGGDLTFCPGLYEERRPHEELTEEGT